jgi:anaerobic sulfite reductase subunit B
MMVTNEYIPFISKLTELIKHTDMEYTFRLTCKGKVKPGQFFEVSIPKYGEAPISVSGVGDGTIDLTIHRVGTVTDEIFKRHVGDTFLLRGPYGNGFDLDLFRNKEIIVVAGGTGVAPIHGVVDYFAYHPEECKKLTLIAGFRNPGETLFVEDLKRWQKTINLIVTYDQADENSGYQVGLVTKYIPDLKIDDIDNTEAIVVGPPIMIKFAAEALFNFDFPEEHIWISQSRKMCCGLGKCGHCKVGDVYICQDGPVFNYTKGRTLID